jgi:hypothetical protein
MDVEEQADKPFFIVKTLTDRSIKLDYSPALTVGDVKELVMAKEYLESNASIRLILKNVVLADDLTLGVLFPATTVSKDVPPGDGSEQGDKKVKDESEQRKLYWFYYEPTALIVDPIDVVSEWDAKNRMRIFKGLYCFSRRRFSEAARLLCDSLSTFAETDFISFVSCVKYAVIAASFTLDRTSLYRKVLSSDNVQQRWLGFEIE